MAPAMRPRRRASRIERLARAKLRLSGHRRHDPDQPAGEQQHEDRRESHANCRTHREGGLRQRRHRHRQRAIAAFPLHRDTHLPGARAHQPQVTGEQSRCVFRLHGAIGNGRELRTRAGQRQRHDVHLAHIVGRGQHFDVGDAGNNLRRADGDEQPVWACEAFEKHIGAADVRASVRLEGGRDQQQQKARRADPSTVALAEVEPFTRPVRDRMVTA